MNIKLVLKTYLLFGCFYLILDGLLHFLNIRTLDTPKLWPESARVFSQLISLYYGSFAIFVGCLMFLLQTNIDKYISIIKLSAIFAFIHAWIIIYTSFTTDFPHLFYNLPSITVNIPYFNQFLLVESALLFGYSILVILYTRKYH